MNNTLFLVETYRGRIQATVEDISPVDIPTEVTQGVGEDLRELLGIALEVKIQLRKIMTRFENLL